MTSELAVGGGKRYKKTENTEDKYQQKAVKLRTARSLFVCARAKGYIAELMWCVMSRTMHLHYNRIRD